MRTEGTYVSVRSEEKIPSSSSKSSCIQSELALSISSQDEEREMLEHPLRDLSLCQRCAPYAQLFMVCQICLSTVARANVKEHGERVG